MPIQNAQAIFIAGKSSEPNTFAVFCRDLTVTDTENIEIELAARTSYRLTCNGRILAHDPARCGHGHARTDLCSLSGALRPGLNRIAVEVAGYAGAFAVENDHTCEYSFFIAEIRQNGVCISATGADAGWKGKLILQRERRAQRHSHCRPITEVWHLDENYGDFAALPDEKLEAVPCPVLLERGVPYPHFQYEYTDVLLDYGQIVPGPGKRVDTLFFEREETEYTRCSERPASENMHTAQRPLSNGTVRHDGETCFLSDDPVKYALFDFGKMYVGFLTLEVTLPEAAVCDILYSDRMEADGTILSQIGYNTCVRLYCPKGKTSFTTFEPYAFRYVKFVLHTAGRCTLHRVGVLTWYTPDSRRGNFSCSDENLNRIYDAARRTLQLNTLDLFMDCPDRERGGWLCDSLWTARAARMMLGDSSVERAMLQNFLCLPAEQCYHAFFPSCYPAAGDFAGGTIMTWTFWLVIEFSEYIRRTGDTEMLALYRPRLEAFYRVAEELCDSHGLFETQSTVFINWSLSNEPNYTGPISCAANVLYACALETLDELYRLPGAAARAAQIRAVLRRHAVDRGTFDPRFILYDSLGPAADGTLAGRPYFSEAAQYTMLWGGLFTEGEEPELVDAVVQQLGPCPTQKPPKLDIGPANLFIGLCVRLDMLARLKKPERLLEEIRTLCGVMLGEGPGTLWETLGGITSRCHGFTSHFGVWLARDILGIGIPQVWPKKTVRIAPHACGLRFAQGTVDTPDGTIGVHWCRTEHSFTLSVNAPAEYEVVLELPAEIRCCDTVTLNGQPLSSGSREIGGLHGGFLLAAADRL